MAKPNDRQVRLNVLICAGTSPELPRDLWDWPEIERANGEVKRKRDVERRDRGDEVSPGRMNAPNPRVLSRQRAC